MDEPLMAPSPLSDSSLRRLARRRGYRLHKRQSPQGTYWTVVDEDSNEVVYDGTKYRVEHWLRNEPLLEDE